jgi:hypothetical protein
VVEGLGFRQRVGHLTYTLKRKPFSSRVKGSGIRVCGLRVLGLGFAG